MDQTGGGIYVQRSPPDDQNIGVGDVADRSVHQIHVQSFFIQYDVRLDNAAAAAAGHHFRSAPDRLQIVKLSAALTMVSGNSAVQFQDLAASGCLMQPVYILRNDGLKFAFRLQLRQCFVRLIGFCALDQHFIPVKTVKLIRPGNEKAVAQDLFRRIIVFHIVDAVNTPEIRDPAFGRDSGASEENDIIAFIYPFL